MDVDASQHGRPHLGDGHRRADAGRMVVDQVFLELAHLLVGQHHLGEFADAGVDAVHDLTRFDALLDESAAFLDSFHGIGMEFDLIQAVGHLIHIFHFQIFSGHDNRHMSSLNFMG